MEIVNKVAQSGILTLELDKQINDKKIVLFDLKDFLFQGLVLKEKEFRYALKNLETESFHGKYVGVFCSTDAIVPLWAYMLIASKLEGICTSITFGNKSKVEELMINDWIDQLNPNDFEEKRVVIKGCFDKPIPTSAYLRITQKLKPIVKSIMYGEPCSTVPIYKQKK